MRYGCDGGLVDFAAAEVVPVADMLEETVEAVYADAEELGCVAELEQALEIPRRGTSAHRQLRVYREARTKGAGPEEALRRVVDSLIQETVQGL